MRVPIYDTNIPDKHIAHIYEHTNINADTVGMNVQEAQAKLGNTVRNAALQYEDKINKSKIVDLTNQIDKYYSDTLYDKDNGYLNKSGKNAMNQTENMLKGYDDYTTELLKSSGLRGKYLDYAKNSVAAKRIKYNEIVNRHDFEQTQNWQNTVYADKLGNIVNQAVFDRNDDNLLSENLKQGFNAVELQGQLLNRDEEETKLAKKQFASNFHSAVIKSLLSDNNAARAKNYYKAHKEELLPNVQNSILESVNNSERRYNARILADDIISSSASEEEALRKAENIDDYEQAEYVSSKIRQKYSEKRRMDNQYQSDLMNNFYDFAAAKIKNGETITIDDLPQGLNGKNYLLAKNAVDSFNKSGDVKTDGETLTYLQHTAAYDAQRFKNLDLSMYRLSLSDADFKTLQKRQESIKKGNYYTVLKDNKATIDYIEQVTGIKNADKKLFEQYQQMIRNLEERTGEKATDIEKEQFLKYLGADKNNYKTIEKKVKDNAEFYADIANKVSYYQSKHNGDMPDTDTFNKWLKEETVQYSNKKYTQYLNYAKTNVTAKPHEQKILTYFADDYVPSLSKEIGVNLKVSSRYRPANGKYKSKHSEGRALDISYLTKEGKSLTVNQKFNLIENVLQRPEVQAIAISSADKDGKAVLEMLMKKYGKKYGSKIQDMNRPDANGKTRDQNLGTNHTHHVHITLYSDKTFGGTDPVTVKNQLKQRGFTDEKIADYIKARGLS